MSKKKDKKGKKKSAKGKSKNKKGKKGKKKLDKKRLAKKKSDKKKPDKKSKKKKRSSKQTNDMIQPVAALATGDSSPALMTNEAVQTIQATTIPGNGNYTSNYGVFEWDGTRWTLVENCCDYGCNPCQPSEPGGFVGERTVTACLRNVEGMSCPPSE